jgi:hypothetical protein
MMSRFIVSLFLGTLQNSKDGVLPLSKKLLRMSGQENIVVLGQFDSVIEANIAKTKLDAHGVPCFLTDENMSSLYPGQPFQAFKVRLYILASDKSLAMQILSDVQLTNIDDHTSCPKCNSVRVVREFPKALAETLTILFFGVLFPHKKVNHCLDCDNEF